MATVKADAHFVDGDISTGSGTWESVLGGNIDGYAMTYFNENGLLWGVPLYNQTILRMIEGASTVDSGVDLVGIPVTEHRFRIGETVILTGFTDATLNTSFIVQAESTSNLLVIDKAGAHSASTMNGDETIVARLSLTAGIGRCCQSSTGIIYFGSNRVNNTYITEIANDLTLSYDTVSLVPDPWPTSGSWTVSGMKLSADETHLFIYLTSNSGRLYKFNLATGALVWLWAIGASVGYSLEIDDNDNLYTVGDNGGQPILTKITTDGVATNLTGMSAVGDYNVNDDMNIIVGGDLNNIQAVDLDGSNFRSISSGGTITAQDIQFYEGEIYVLRKSANTMYKYDSDLTLIKSGLVTNDIGSRPDGFYFDLYGNLVVIIQDNGVAPGHTVREDPLHFFDRDTLTLLAAPDGIYSGIFQLWDADTVFDTGNHLFYLGITNPTSYAPPTSHQYRASIGPEDYKHLEGQEVQILADGIHLDDTTYTIASGLVSPTYTATTDHVGLQVVSKLQPMKIDGEVDVKRIRYLIPDVFESVGGEYGKELDDMYDVKLRASGDPMDKDQALYSGYVELPFKGEYDRQGDIWITQDIPLPMNLLGLGVKLSKESI